MKNVTIVVIVCLLVLVPIGGYFYKQSGASGSNASNLVAVNQKKPSPEEEEKDFLNLFFTEQMKGREVSAYFCPLISVKSLYAVRSWTVIDQNNEGKYTLRIQSSTEGGLAIEKLWTVQLIKDNGKFCVLSFKEK